MRSAGADAVIARSCDEDDGDSGSEALDSEDEEEYPHTNSDVKPPRLKLLQRADFRLVLIFPAGAQ